MDIENLSNELKNNMVVDLVNTANQTTTDTANQTADKSICHMENNILEFICPHCSNWIEVPLSDLACRIFRHGYFIEYISKQPLVYKLINQIPPHATEVECSAFLSNPNIIGCCKPFQIISDGDKYKVIQCGYI